ncbi:MAG: hypothetical protein Q8K86_06600 [Candidatus Nanopelagicaceae bacterium]|nr:hypothetical protein [Candidatus Nanopelagicaceae bacterium]
MTGGFVIAETEFSGGKIIDVRAGLGVGFGFGDFGVDEGVDEGVDAGVVEGVKVGFGVGTFTKTPLFQINFLPDLIQVKSLPL